MPKSIETISPSRNFRFADGIPCTISLFTDVHSKHGYPRYPLNAGLPGFPAISSSACFSRSIVVMPGFTAARNAFKTSFTASPARCIFSSSAVLRS